MELNLDRSLSRDIDSDSHDSLDDVDFPNKEAVVHAVKEVAHKAVAFTHRAIGDTPETLLMLDRLRSQVQEMSATISALNRVILDITNMNLQLLSALNNKSKK